MTALSSASGILRGVTTGNWNTFKNSAQIFLGNYYLDENASFLGGVLQGYSRHSWEILQNGLGLSLNQFRNTLWRVDRVDYLAGATFSTNESSQRGGGCTSLGAFMAIRIVNEIGSDFEGKVISDPVFMHEYGHTFDSRMLGSAYLLEGLLSLVSAISSKTISSEPEGVTTHKYFFTERRANQHAKQYFGKYYNANWYAPYKLHPDWYYEKEYPIEIYYPTKKR